MGDQPGAGGFHSYKIRGHSRQRRSTKPYSRPSDRKKGVLESVKDFFSPSWLVDFWKGKITHEEEVEEDEDLDEPGDPVDTTEKEQGSSRPSTEVENTRLSGGTGGTSSNTRKSSGKVFGNGGLVSVASAQKPSQTSRKTGLAAFLALTSRHQSNKETAVTPRTETFSTNIESSGSAEQECLEGPASSGSVSDHIDTKTEDESTSQTLLNKAVSTKKYSESSSTSFVLNPGPSRKSMPSLFGTSTPMPGASTTTPVAPLSILTERPETSESRPQPTSVFRSRPEFSVAAFGSPLPPRSSQSKRFSSPYYSGKTTFGGASSQFSKSSKRMRVSSPGSLEPQRPVKKQIKPTPIAGPGVGGVASQTAKRILETLEKMSTPLVDAKKIPPSPPFSASSSPLSFTQSSRRKQPYQPNRAIGSPKKLQARFGVPPVQSLSVPQRASISRIQQKTQSIRTSTITSQTQETTSTGQLSSIGSSKPMMTFTPTPLPMSLSPVEPSKGVGKMKTAKSNTHYKSQLNTDNKEEVVNPLPEITSAVPLSIPSSAKLPTFSFSPSSTSAKSSSITTTSKMDFSFVPPKSKSTDITSNNFKFSIPEPKASSSSASTSNQTSPDRKTYSFSLPAPVTKSDTSTKSDDVKSTPPKSLLDKYKPAEGSWECETCMINNKASDTACIACLTPKPSLEVTLPSNDLFKKFAPPPGSWSCEACLISNKSTDNKCVACNTPKSSSNMSSTPSGTMSDDLLKKFAPSKDSWECESCMLNNKGSDSKCVACQTPKPASSQSTSKSVVSQSDDLMKKFAPSKDSWECNACMLNNKGSDSKCVACQMAKPSSSQKPSIPVISKSDDLMKKFAPSPDSWECSTCMLNNKSSNNKCVACQTPKPGGESSSSTSSAKFTFGTGTLSNKFVPTPGSWTCDTCMIVNKPDTLKCLACESAKPGSTSTGTISLAAGLTTTTKSSFTFGGSSVKSTAKANFQFGVTSTSKSDSSTPSVSFTFGSNAEGKSTQPVSFGGPTDTKKSEIKTDGSSFTFGIPVASTSDTKESNFSSTAPGFTFGSSAVNTTSTKPTIQFGISADSRPSESPQRESSTVELGSNATSGNSRPKIQFGTTVKPDEKKTMPFMFGGNVPTLQFGNGSLIKESSPKTSEMPLKGKHSTIAEAAAAGLLQIPKSTTPVPVVDLTDEDSSQDKGTAPPNINFFQSGTAQSANLLFTTASTVVTTKSGTAGSITLPSLPFAFGAAPVSKPAAELPKAAVPAFSFMSGASNTAVPTAAAPVATASSFKFPTLGSNNEAMSNPTTSSVVTPQFGSFVTPASTSVPGFPAVLNTTTSANSAAPFSFKATTDGANGKFRTSAPAAGGFTFSTPASSAASGSGMFNFGATNAVAPTAPSASSAPFVFGSQNTNEQKGGFDFTAPTQSFAFGAGASATPNTQGSVAQHVSEESMDADGNNNSSQPAGSAVPAFGSQLAASVTPFNFNAAPANPSFDFGNMQAAGAFKFGATAPGGSAPAAAPAPTFGTPTPSIPASVGFNFGSPATNSISSQQPAGFMAAGSSGAFTAGTGGVQRRIIKKGVRRMKR